MKYLIPAFITLPAFANSIQFLFILFVLLAPVWTRWVLAKETGRGRQNSESGDEIHESETEKTAVYVFKSVSGGFAIIICSVIAASLCAVLFPVPEEEEVTE